MAPSAITPPASPSVIGSDRATYDLDGTTRSGSAPGYRGYDHITWYVGNAKQAASYYTTRMGFKLVAKRGLETGSRFIASHVISNGGATFVLTSPLRSSGDISESVSEEERALLEDMHAHLKQHGDAVKDVAFEVDDVEAVYSQAVSKGAVSVQQPKILSDKRDGEVKTAVIRTYGDTTHTLVERSRYHGAFMPGYRAASADHDPLERLLPSVPIEAIDHCVGNQDWDQMESACE